MHTSLSPLRLAEVPEEGTVTDEYFYQMMTPENTALVKPYEDEEHACISKVMDRDPDISQKNIVVIGAGNLSYLDLAINKAKNYVAVEPLSHIFISDEQQKSVAQSDNIFVLNKKFQDITPSDLPEGNCVYIFIFNIISYIHEPLDALNALIKKGDTIIISTWNTTSQPALNLRKTYFDALNVHPEETCIDPDDTVGLCNLDVFPFAGLSHYSHHVRETGTITDNLIIYV